MSTALATTNGQSQNAALMEQVAIQGDLSQLKPQERVAYYQSVCESLGLNPLTQPFEYIELNGKLKLYAKRDCTEQLRKIHGVSIEITDRQTINGVYVVTARATDKTGRVDESTGAVCIEKEGGEWQTSSNGKRYFKGNGKFSPLAGEELANAMMKSETKAKRRVTLSVVGLGWIDETEIDSIPNAGQVIVDKETGEIKGALSQGTAKSKPESKFISASQRTEFNAIAEGLGWQYEETRALLQKSGLASVKEITTDRFEKACDALKNKELHKQIIKELAEKEKIEEAEIESSDPIGDGLDQYGNPFEPNGISEKDLQTGAYKD